MQNEFIYYNSYMKFSLLAMFNWIDSLAHSHRPRKLTKILQPSPVSWKIRTTQKHYCVKHAKLPISMFIIIKLNSNIFKQINRKWRVWRKRTCQPGLWRRKEISMWVVSEWVGRVVGIKTEATKQRVEDQKPTSTIQCFCKYCNNDAIFGGTDGLKSNVHVLLAWNLSFLSGSSSSEPYYYLLYMF